MPDSLPPIDYARLAEGERQAAKVAKTEHTRQVHNELATLYDLLARSQHEQSTKG